MNITAGLLDRIVLQRNNRNVSDAEFSGDTQAAGDVIVRVTKGGKKVKGFDGKVVGKASNGKITGRLTGLPAGGPYDVVVAVVGHGAKAQTSVADKQRIKSVLVGDVWIAAGQSNMQGCGNAQYRAKPDPMVRAFYMDDHWATAVDPIHQLNTAVDSVHNGGIRTVATAPNPKGVGPAIHFAQDMYRRTRVPQGIIACAHGGTSMSQWDPKLKSKGGASLYGASMRRLEKNGGKIAGVIWYQGESDCNSDASRQFTPRMKELIAAFRKDARNPKLPFVQVQLGRLLSIGFDVPSWNSVQDQQRRLAQDAPFVSQVAAYDLQLDDTIHVGGRGMAILGARLAYAMDVLRRGSKAGKPPITLKKVNIKPNPVSGQVDVLIDFDNVVGSLHVPGGIRPTGFSLVDNRPVPIIYDIELRGHTVVLHTNFAMSGLGDKTVYHGWGIDTYCNVQDEAGRLIPVFGPVATGEPRAVTPMVERINIAFPIAIPTDSGVDTKLNGLKYPADQANFPWKLNVFENRFCDIHLQTAVLEKQDFIAYFKCTLEVPEPMKLDICLGYDGPVKAWIDGEEVFHDPQGNNPAWEDRGTAPIKAKPGSHEVIVALASNKNNAWGIFLRFERKDVSKEQLKLGVVSCVLPSVRA
ncbi:MAG: hypothetical protein IT444_10805 [Phycisphaeraceae bacterium]|nr:hypothetical protein [Phycisphaeraceae bacterium]